MLLSAIIFLACGALGGVLAGLLGVGGGIVLVPLLVMVLPMQGVPATYVQHLALGTSLASIIFTSIASSRAHAKRGAVRWDIWRSITPGILLGTFFGGLIASGLPTFFLKAFFICFLYFVAVQMLLDIKPKASRELPHMLGMNAVGGGIGLVSSFVGIGGGTLSVPFMTFCNIPMHTAVGTSAAIGFPIAVAGALGYVAGGWNVADLPAGTLGYVHIPALLGIATASFCTAPLGAKLSHALPVKTLKRGFALFLLVVASRMLWGLIA